MIPLSSLFSLLHPTPALLQLILSCPQLRVAICSPEGHLKKRFETSHGVSRAFYSKLWPGNLHDLQVTQLPEAGQPWRQLCESVVAQPEGGQVSELADGRWKHLQLVVIQQQLLQTGRPGLWAYCMPCRWQQEVHSGLIVVTQQRN